MSQIFWTTDFELL